MAPRTWYFHFISIWNASLAPSASWLPFSSDANRSARHNSFPLWRQSLRGLHCGLVMIFNYTDAFTRGVKRRWGSLQDQRFGPKVDFCVLADAFSRDARLKSAPGYKKAISRPEAVCISNRGAAKSGIGWSHGLWDSDDKHVYVSLFFYFLILIFSCK